MSLEEHKRWRNFLQNARITYNDGSENPVLTDHTVLNYDFQPFVTIELPVYFSIKDVNQLLWHLKIMCVEPLKFTLGIEEDSTPSKHGNNRISDDEWRINWLMGLNRYLKVFGYNACRSIINAAGRGDIYHDESADSQASVQRNKTGFMRVM
jgi:hypothetical protein